MGIIALGVTRMQKLNKPKRDLTEQCNCSKKTKSSGRTGNGQIEVRKVTKSGWRAGKGYISALQETWYLRVNRRYQ